MAQRILWITFSLLFVLISLVVCSSALTQETANDRGKGMSDDERAAYKLLVDGARMLEDNSSNDQQEGKAREEAVGKLVQAAEKAPKSHGIQQTAAELLYRIGEVEKSLPLFDRVIKLLPSRAPENWQRGIALCTAEKWKEGAEQFKTHHDVNPNDVENSAWYFLCIAKLEGIEAARKTVIPSRGDGREPMMSILAMLKGKLEPKEVLQAAIDNTTEKYDRDRAKFYADLYVALYYDSLGNEEQTVQYLKASLKHGNTGYMVDTAQVYLTHRFAEKAAKN